MPANDLITRLTRAGLTLLAISTGSVNTSTAEEPTTNQAPPNIIIFVSDDQGFADASFRGSDIKTPNIDRLATEGVVLNQFYVTPICSPTRAGLLTGRWPVRFGMQNAVVAPWRDRGLPPEEITFANMLAKNGYNHRACIGKWHLGHNSRKYHPKEHGFSHFYGHYNGSIDYFTHLRNNQRDWHRNFEPITEEGYITDLKTAEAIQFINSVPTNEPYLLYLPFLAPHSPFQAKEEDLAHYPHRQGNRRLYAAMIDSMDQAIGKILAAAKERGDLDNTFILFFSDNGGEPGVADNGPHRGAKFTLYQGGVRSLAVAHWPNGGISGGKIINERMGYIDITPSLRHLAGLSDPPPNPLDGINVIPAMRGDQKLPDRPWFNFFLQNPNSPPLHSVQTNQWKLITKGHIDDPNFTDKNNIELYNWQEDPLEQNNLASNHPDVVASLLTSIRSFRNLEQSPPMPLHGEGRTNFSPPENWAIPD